MMALVPDLDADTLLQRQYVRASSLNRLGRTDEALMQYQMLAETAPESIWGMLAALHSDAM